jgi:hypothetical protein
MKKTEKALPPHPMQPLVKDPKGGRRGVVRFRGNAVVQYLLDEGGLSLNDLAKVDFPQEDLEQFAQLIGYSLCGYHELSYVSDDSALAASKASGGYKGCRDGGCEIHIGVPKEKQQPNWKPPR